jgi:glycosyltransferase involved in cell wall biosynthesis
MSAISPVMKFLSASDAQAPPTAHAKACSVVVVMPALNAEKTLKLTVDSIPKTLGARILLVDDASSDQTVKAGRKLGLKVIVHPKTLGYGANQKTCYTECLRMNPDIVVMVHPDYQYDARMLPSLILPIQLGICDVMLGNRIRSRDEALKGGMPLYKYIANRALTVLENSLLGQNLGELHSGLRAYRKEVLGIIPWQENSDDFVFDQQFLIQCAYFGLRMGDVPVPARYFSEASSINLGRSIRYGFQTLWTLFLYFLARGGLFKTRIFRSPKMTK